MAGLFQQFLKGAGVGFLDSAYLRDYTHASKTFIGAGKYDNSPKYKWLFHVYFNINKLSVSNVVEKDFPTTINHGLLVKRIDLPKFNISLQEMNQYNRKRFIQTKINYDPIRIVFHDDNANQIRHLWFSYFNYHYNDPSQPLGSQSQLSLSSRTDADKAAKRLNYRNIYNPSIAGETDWGYAGEGVQRSRRFFRGSKENFFTSIKIYGFNQHNFALYELINPIIENFSHDSYDYYETRGVMENQMTIRYETVKYYEGALNGEKPGELVDRFGEIETYDRTPSPITRDGNNKSILGTGGLVDAGAGILEELTKGNYLSAIQKGARVGTTFKNGKEVLQAAKAEAFSVITQEATRVLSTPQAIQRQRNLFNIPAAGSGASSANQQFNRLNLPPINPPPVSR